MIKIQNVLRVAIMYIKIIDVACTKFIKTRNIHFVYFAIGITDVA